MSVSVRARPGKVYFVAWAADGQVMLTVDDPGASQVLSLPLGPSNAVPDALPLVDPVFAHYIAQWEKLLAPGGGELPRGFWIEASAMPIPMVAARHLPRLSALVRRHAPPPAASGTASLHLAAVSAEAAGIARYVWE